MRVCKNFIYFWFPVLLWMSLIFYFSSIPDLSPNFSKETMNILTSKFAHIVEYAILTLLLLRAIEHTFSLSPQALLQIIFLIAVLYAISDEYHQLFVHGREGTFRDIMIDSIGITLIPLYLTSKNKAAKARRLSIFHKRT